MNLFSPTKRSLLSSKLKSRCVYQVVLSKVCLFSGGEASSIVIALIFALLKSNLPFCFMRLMLPLMKPISWVTTTDYLNLFSDRFQFIVTSHHRRKTMEVLDTLYGVTMQEPGVSKVVGVGSSKSLPAHLQKAFKEKELPKIDKKPEPPAF